MFRLSFFHYVTLALFLGLFGLPLVYEGGFFDGIHYAIISQNLAHNIGDFWHLQWLNKTPFFEHPPLFFFIESLFFRLFGGGFWVGNLFVFLLAVNVLILITPHRTTNRHPLPNPAPEKIQLAHIITLDKRQQCSLGL